MYRVADLYRMTDDPRLHDVAQNNIAYAEYRAGNLHKAEDLYVKIMESPSVYKDLEFTARKGYVQTLLKVKKRTKANLLIEKSLSELESLALPKIQAWFLLLHAHSQNDVESAKKVLDLPDLDDSTYLLACKCLMEHCEQVQDGEGFLKYHQMAGAFQKNDTFQQGVYLL